jgi:hypothetical protein
VGDKVGEIKHEMSSSSADTPGAEYENSLFIDPVLGLLDFEAEGVDFVLNVEGEFLIIYIFVFFLLGFRVVVGDELNFEFWGWDVGGFLFWLLVFDDGGDLLISLDFLLCLH